MITDDKCPRCDRSNCPAFDSDMRRVDRSLPMTPMADRAFRDCDVHAIDWRARAQAYEKALVFYADPATYKREPFVELCQNSWHNESHGIFSNCPSCGKDIHKRGAVHGLREPAINEHGAKAREALAR